MPIVTFRYAHGEEIRTEVPAGLTLLEAAKQAGVAIDAPCGGSGTCGKCRVRLLSGEPEMEQNPHLSREDYAAGWRLACCTRVTGDTAVEVPETASAYRTGIRTADLSDPTVRGAFEAVQRDLKAAGVMEEPALTVREVVLEPATLEDTMPDNERLERALMAELGAERVTLSLTTLKKLAALLRENDYRLTCVLRKHGSAVQVADIHAPGLEHPACGLAIDIGTTTVSAALADMEDGTLLARASAGNGQIRFGADVISRIIESTRPGGSQRLKKAVVEETLVPLIAAMCRDSGIPLDRIYRVSIAGNTTMNHLLLGLYADPIRMEPFVPSFFRCETLRASEVIPGLSPAAELVITPNVGSYVGGDITAGVLASSLWESDELSLFIDLGTNGELVLGNGEYMLCCACSAGPAFEGGDISCGMRATDGAIEAVKIDKATMEPALDVIGEPGQKPRGLCGSGIIDTVAELFRAGIIDARGKFVRSGDRVLRDEDGMGRYVLAWAADAADGRDVTINEVDLDNFIRAKGAIFSAAHLLMEQVGVSPEDISRFWIAGGIGGGIDFHNAITIGMFPDLPHELFHYIGNSSLSGAYAVLLSSSAWAKTEELGKCMMYVELSNEPKYMDEFVSACFLPHTDHTLFPSVEKELN